MNKRMNNLDAENNAFVVFLQDYKKFDLDFFGKKIKHLNIFGEINKSIGKKEKRVVFVSKTGCETGKNYGSYRIYNLL